MKNRSIILWLIAILLTVATAVYQRVTGPTYPIKGETELGEKIIHYKLDRAHAGDTNNEVKIETKDQKISGLLVWKRFKTNDAWHKQEMKYENGYLTGTLPNQPPAGKLVYKIILNNNKQQITIPEEPVIIRFRGDVPVFIIIPHVILIFLAMLLSTRTGLEYFNKNPNYKKLTYWTFVILIIGGLIFGPLMQKYAFGEFWTGIPFGIDLTDNKTLIAVIGWIIALIALKKSVKPQRWIIFASILMFVIYLIPHSVLGSELDYNELDRQNQIEKRIE